MCMFFNKKKDPSHFEMLTERLRRADAAVESEYEENNRRLNWTLIFHAFLIQAYATCLQILDNDQNTNGTDNLFAWSIIFVICTIGTLTAFITVKATGAAIDAICIEKNTREKVEIEAVEYGFESHGFPIKEKLHRLGLLPTKYFPVILLSAWVIISGISIYQIIS